MVNVRRAGSTQDVRQQKEQQMQSGIGGGREVTTGNREVTTEQRKTYR